MASLVELNGEDKVFPKVSKIVADATKVKKDSKNPGFRIIHSDGVKYHTLKSELSKIDDDPDSYVARESTKYAGYNFIVPKGQGGTFNA